MLENRDKQKPKEVHLINKDWYNIKKLTLERIINKLEAAKELLKVSRYDNVSAGLYTYAIEEFGKLIILNNCEQIAKQTKKKIKYKNEFTCHEKKIGTAFDYLQDYSSTSYKCYVLNDEGSYSPRSFTWRGYNIGLLADFKARMSIFYTDLSYQSNKNGEATDEIIIEELPKIERKLLYEAIDELRTIISQFSI
jgi:AbiV family abortive infection protein